MNTRKVSGATYAATVLGALAVLAIAPATAYAVDNEPTTGGSGCSYTDKDGYSVPLDNGQDVFIDGKIVSCRNGKITVTTAPLRGNANRAPVVDRNAAPVLAKP